MQKGAATRQAILTHASGLASQVGLTGLTIGALADHLHLSKSGLFAHFKSKEALQIQVLEHAAAQFVAAVVKPALAEPRGEARLRALFARWLEWEQAAAHPGGCVFVAASSELDDRPGPVRERLAALQRDWLGVIATTFRKGIEAGRIKPGADGEQFAQDFYGVMLAYHLQRRLLDDPRAEARARTAFDRLLEDARA